MFATPMIDGMDGDFQLRNCKLPLSLHDLLDSPGRTHSSPFLTPPDRASTLSSDDELESKSEGQVLLSQSSLRLAEAMADEERNIERRSFQPYHSQSVPKSENLEAHASACFANGVPITTMMLRNIPNKYTQNSLLKEINEHGFAGTYDFFYLPMDVHNRSNVGYAFINFENPAEAERFHTSFANHRFRRFHSRKIGSVCVAHVQGLNANLRHFENRAVTQARNDQYRPLVLSGQQRMDFDHAVTRAKARTPGHCGPGQPGAGADPREALESAIRKLLTSSDDHSPPPSERIQPAAVCAGHDGTTTQEEDIAQLLSLRNLLINQLHTHREGPAYIQPCSFGMNATATAASM